MAGTTTTVSTGEVSSGIGTTTGGQVDQVSFNRDADKVTIFNYDGADWLWVTVDGSDPTVGGKNTVPVMPSGGIVLSVPTAGNTVVKLTSGTATKYVVTDAA